MWFVLCVYLFVKEHVKVTSAAHNDLALVSCLPFVIWQKHVTDNFPNASSAKHAVSMSELGQVLTGNLSGVPQKNYHSFLSNRCLRLTVWQAMEFDNQSDYADCLYCDWHSFETIRNLSC